MPKTVKNPKIINLDLEELQYKLPNLLDQDQLKKKENKRYRTINQENPNLPADKKIEYDRALKGLKVELQNSQVQNKAKVLAKKYHMVRFFERKKAVRKLKNLRKEFERILKLELEKILKS